MSVQQLSVYVSVYVVLTKLSVFGQNRIWLGLKMEVHSTNRKAYF